MRRVARPQMCCLPRVARSRTRATLIAAGVEPRRRSTLRSPLPRRTLPPPRALRRRALRQLSHSSKSGDCSSASSARGVPFTRRPAHNSFAHFRLRGASPRSRGRRVRRRVATSAAENREASVASRFRPQPTQTSRGRWARADRSDVLPASSTIPNRRWQGAQNRVQCLASGPCGGEGSTVSDSSLAAA